MAIRSLFKQHNIAFSGAVIQLLGAVPVGVVIDVDNAITNQTVQRVMSSVRAIAFMSENSDGLIRVSSICVTQSSPSGYVNSDFFFVAAGDTMVHLKANQLNEQILR